MHHDLKLAKHRIETNICVNKPTEQNTLRGEHVAHREGGDSWNWREKSDKTRQKQNVINIHRIFIQVYFQHHYKLILFSAESLHGHTG